ncbi:RsmB/NOP family class I SAM-dependent RNA methyltransferase [Amaricoccus macauensis]|uniref:RsmB/NOP family class I SAM-dependent RNA methyltransferase n=1 Tax=Amaricoccus macauensis TaxID=57001 RepID=UPI003C7EA89D
MTPGARLSAAIGLLDEILAGAPAERALSRWARASRFAGSKDRAAIRDLVFEGLRRRRSLGWLGGGDTGRAIVLAGQATEAADLDMLFTGQGYDPAPVTPEERDLLGRSISEAPTSVQLDLPDFLLPEFQSSLGGDFADVLREMQSRAPVDLRVNTLKSNRNAAMVVLARDGVAAEPVATLETALRVVENPRLVNASRAYTQGMVELQDVSSQIAAAFAGARPGMTVLDYCAGGGGKTLALASDMKGQGRLMAWDINPRRMKDLPDRARRAGAEIEILDSSSRAALGPVCDIVFVDAPCSGTGAWRRQPEGKWALVPERLEAFGPLQQTVLAEASVFVRPGGRLVYATCSLLKRENEDQVARFLSERPDWRLEEERRLTPLDGGDGFYMARLVAPEA